MRNDDQELYVYALASSGLPRRIDVDGHRLRVVTVGAVDAVVEVRAAAPRPTEPVLREQHEIVSVLGEMTDALLPARFGTIASWRMLTALLSGRQADIMDALMLVRGRRQMTVRVFGAAPAGAAQGHPATGTGYLKARRARSMAPAEVELIRNATRRWVTAERVEPGARGLRVTLFHLVPARAAGGYRRAVQKLAPSLAPLRVSVSGPWPAFAFAPELS